MKPKEFDDLIRQKFDQDDFAYNPRNWDQLEEQMDGRAKKRSVMIWWLMPLAGIAASVALAIGVAPLLHQSQNISTPINESYAKTYNIEEKHVQQYDEPVIAGNNDKAVAVQHKTVAVLSRKHNGHETAANEADGFAIRYQNAIGSNNIVQGKKKINLLDVPKVADTKSKKKQQDLVINEGYNTFKETAAPRKAPKFSILLIGGVGQGSQGTAYTGGATIHKMLSDKMFFESDIAFLSSSNTQSKLVAVPGDKITAAKSPAGKFTTAESSKTTNIQSGSDKVKNVTESYNLNYAQVSPSLGFKIIKKMSVGVGPDFQEMLADNRPSTSTVDKHNQTVNPIFDVGLVGKSEVSVTRAIKAGVSYRMGINNVLTPMGKYIDRDYVQFQLKCAIFNR